VFWRNDDLMDAPEIFGGGGVVRPRTVGARLPLLNELTDTPVT